MRNALLDSMAARKLGCVNLGQRNGTRCYLNGRFPADVFYSNGKQYRIASWLLNVSKTINYIQVARTMVSWTRPLPALPGVFNGITRTPFDYRKTRIKTFKNHTKSIQTLPNSIKGPGDRDIENHLRRLKLPFRNGYTSIVAPCPTCRFMNVEEAGTRESRSWNLFINKMTGKFVCKKCGHSGLWNEIKVKTHWFCKEVRIFTFRSWLMVSLWIWRTF